MTGHERIEAALAKLGAEHEPPPGWERRVLAAVEGERKRSWWMYMASGVTLAAAASIAMLVLWPKPAPLALAVELQASGGTRLRGDQIEERAVGDIVHLAVTGGKGQRAIRVYRDETHLVARCPEDATCRVSRGEMTVDVKLDLVGEYKIVALSWHGRPPSLPGNYDEDTAKAMKSQAEKQERLVRAQ